MPHFEEFRIGYIEEWSRHSNGAIVRSPTRRMSPSILIAATSIRSGRPRNQSEIRGAMSAATIHARAAVARRRKSVAWQTTADRSLQSGPTDRTPCERLRLPPRLHQAQQLLAIVLQLLVA